MENAKVRFGHYFDACPHMTYKQESERIMRGTEWHQFLLYRRHGLAIKNDPMNHIGAGNWDPEMLYYPDTHLPYLSVGALVKDRELFEEDVQKNIPRALQFRQEFITWKLIK